jgi:hypothetical protein
LSILLSGYYPEGIVFVADKNATIHYKTSLGPKKYVEPSATKVLSWPRHRAVVGFVGLLQLAGLSLDDWMRIFIAEHRDLKNINAVANDLKDSIEHDFKQDHPSGSDVSQMQMVIHLGGFKEVDGIHVPAMYHIHNHHGIDERTGKYSPAERNFVVSDQFRESFLTWPNPEDYPLRVRERLQIQIDQVRFTWFQNGANLGAFTIFTQFIWHALHDIERAGFGPKSGGIDSRIAFCSMVVEVFGAYFTYHYSPEDRAVGGGVDYGYVPWPKSFP